MTTTGTLEVTTPSDREIVLTRRFRAPRQAVFDAFTKPELLRRWLSPMDWDLTVCEIDPRPGGSWKYTWARPDGSSMTLWGEIKEVTPPERIVETQYYEEAPEPILSTVALTEEPGGGTLLVNTLLYPSKEMRDLDIQYGMSDGAGASYDKLEAMLGA
jgi:uncharacterized protein YndB with AHSA1/START domain